MLLVDEAELEMGKIVLFVADPLPVTNSVGCLRHAACYLRAVETKLQRFYPRHFPPMT